MKKKLLVIVGAPLAVVSSAMAQTSTVADAVTQAQGITTTSTTSYIAAIGLGIGALTVAAVVYFSRKGWKLR